MSNGTSGVYHYCQTRLTVVQILLNMLLLTAGASMYVLQRLFYGPLRAIEIEQLWDKAWYAITETALAMTTFRDEVGGWFFIMFVSLLAGKVWGWISEGRVDIMEQQPPANPRLFHARLMASLLLSETFDLLMLRYCLQTLAAQPRPGMMVMFAFEFAVLAIASSSTTIRYALHLQEKIVIKRQTQLKVEERREEIRNARREAQAQDTQDATTTAPSNLPREEEIDENEIDVPGWQEKGRYILFLDLATGKQTQIDVIEPILIGYRLHETCIISRLLHGSSFILWNSCPHVPRPFHHLPIIC